MVKTPNGDHIGEPLLVSLRRSKMCVVGPNSGHGRKVSSITSSTLRVHYRIFHCTCLTSEALYNGQNPIPSVVTILTVLPNKGSPRINFVDSNVTFPKFINKTEGFLHQCFHWSASVWATKVLNLLLTGVLPVDIVILKQTKLH